MEQSNHLVQILNIIAVRDDWDFELLMDQIVQYVKELGEETGVAIAEIKAFLGLDRHSQLGVYLNMGREISAIPNEMPVIMSESAAETQLDVFMGILQTIEKALEGDLDEA